MPLGTEIVNKPSAAMVLAEKVGIPLLWITLGFILAKWTGKRAGTPLN